MHEIKVDLTRESPSGKVGSDLPEVVVQIYPYRIPVWPIPSRVIGPYCPYPSGQVRVNEVELRNWPLGKFRLDRETVRFSADYPRVVTSSNFPSYIPTYRTFRRLVRLTAVGRYKYIQGLCVIYFSLLSFFITLIL